MTEVKFRGWIYWAYFVLYCVCVYFAWRILPGISPFIFIFIITLFPLLIAGLCEQDNLLACLKRKHRSTWDALNESWHFRDMRLHRFISSHDLDDDPEMLLHKRNFRHLRWVSIATLVVFFVSTSLFFKR